MAKRYHKSTYEFQDEHSRDSPQPIRARSIEVLITRRRVDIES